MTNQSIKNAFSRFWYHVLIKINELKNSITGYSLEKSGTTITLTGTDGSTSSVEETVTIADDDGNGNVVLETTNGMMVAAMNEGGDIEGVSGKTLVGEITLTSENLTESGTTGIYTLSEDLEASMDTIFSTLNKGFDVLAVEMVEMSSNTSTTICTAQYLYGDIEPRIRVILVNSPIESTTFMLDFYNGAIRTNNVNALFDDILGDSSVVTFKFYTVKAGGNNGNEGNNTSITVDDALSSESTNPVQNKVVTQKLTEVENLLANANGKKLIGEITLSSTNTTKTDDNTLVFNDDVKAQVAQMFARLEGFNGVVYIEQNVGDLVCLYLANYVSGAAGLAYKNLQFTAISNPVTSAIHCYIVKEDCLYTNDINNVGYISSGVISVTMKCYTLESGSGGGSNVQANWSQNDPLAPDYVKDRPVYISNNGIIFDQDVTTEAAEGVATYLVADYIINPNTTEIGAMYDVVFNGVTYRCNFSEWYYSDENVTEECLYLGNLNLFAQGEMPEVKDTGEPFLILNMSGLDITFFATQEAGTYHITINSLYIKKLDSTLINWVDGSAPSSLPEVTTDDNDKVLMVVNGNWRAGSIANGDEVSY